MYFERAVIYERKGEAAKAKADRARAAQKVTRLGVPCPWSPASLAATVARSCRTAGRHGDVPGFRFAPACGCRAEHASDRSLRARNEDRGAPRESVQ